MRTHKLNTHLTKIKNIQVNLNLTYEQALTDVTAMHLNCGGKFTKDGDFIMDRESAILYFANNKHTHHYSTPDTL